MKPICEVKISFYKPTGWEDTHYVRTEDRGLAVRTVISLEKYRVHMECLNYISVNHVNVTKVSMKQSILEVMP